MKQKYYKKLLEGYRINSNDPHTQTSAIIVNEDDTIISTGWNSLPDGVHTGIESRFERPEKYHWFVHAEIAAITKAAKAGISTYGSTMYMSCGIPCTDCTKAIINSGIKRIVCDETGGSRQSKWEEHKERSLQMLNEAGIQIEFFNT